MTYKIPLPAGGRSDTLDIVDPNSTAVQRALRRNGLSAYEPPTLTTLLTLFDDLEAGFTFFDVGANMGLYALVCAAMFEPDSVVAFEPTPSTATLLARIVKAGRHHIDVVEAAVGDVEGTATLHFSAKSDASNSMVKGFKESHHSVVVDTITLDGFVRRTGNDPHVMKIDVETFEPAVLAGAASMIERARPAIVIEVLNRRGHDHGDEITEAMEGFGYHYYELADTPDWTAQPVVKGRPGSTPHDWLLTPTPLDAGFGQRWTTWRSRLEHCGPERNSRVPYLLSARAALDRGGVSELLGSGRRYLRTLTTRSK